MEKMGRRVPALLVAALVCASLVANAQSIQGYVDANGKVVYETQLAGTISVSRDVSAVENGAFSCVPVHLLKQGSVLAAKVSDDHAWSVEIGQLLVGKGSVDYPILASVKTPDGKFHSIFPGTVKAKINMRVGVVLDLYGYRIEVLRSIKAGDSFPAFSVGDSVLSVESTGGGRPSFTAFKKDINAEERAADIKAWQIENNRWN